MSGIDDTRAPSPPAAEAALRALLPAAVHLHQVWIDPAVQRLHAEEAADVVHAVERRRHEFAAGRHCARLALDALGVLAGPLRIGPDRAPLWPAGVIGSISHDDGWCAAAVARERDAAGLGIDVEMIDRFRPEQARLICTASECSRELAGLQGAALLGRLARLFTVKEALFKAQFGITRAWLDFADVDVELPAADNGPYRARLLRAAGCFPVDHVFSGGSVLAAERACAALLLPP
jgi:4'-phosphopantetheinyl transferase EntD